MTVPSLKEGLSNCFNNTKCKMERICLFRHSFELPRKYYVTIFRIYLSNLLTSLKSERIFEFKQKFTKQKQRVFSTLNLRCKKKINIGYLFNVIKYFGMYSFCFLSCSFGVNTFSPRD